MKRVRIHQAETIEWNAIGAVADEPTRALLSQEEMDSEVAFHEPGSDHELQLFEIKYKAGAAVAVHAHVEDEIIYIVDGSMKVGNQELLPGSSIFVAGNTLYQFRAGDNGLRFLNFRAHADNTYITRDQYFAERKSRSEA
jgi:mannose-6-phosphate isomerase-like protein (cupin superfamily)